jgi:5'-methylthioadenosine phosphorylase
MKIGIIGGSGLYDIELLSSPKEIKVSTPYGSPSSTLHEGSYGGNEVYFLPRHGGKHTIPPHLVNYRANVWAMKEMGVERIIGTNAVGSLRDDYPPGALVIVDQFIDFTKKREYTFYDGGKVYHVSLADPLCPELRRIAVEIAERKGFELRERGTYVCIEGPRYSTRAESRMFKQFADIIGMTLVPECQLARELEICYLNLSMVTDYDVYAERPVSSKEVVETMKKNVEVLKSMVRELIPKIPAARSCGCSSALKDAEA